MMNFAEFIAGAGGKSNAGVGGFTAKEGVPTNKKNRTS
jgi:hypothetical protein